MSGINVLSLFDGMSCGQQALDRIGVSVQNYFASEIDKYAIQVTMANYPNTIQLGSVTEVDGYKLPKIDLLIGGSPCQSFSFAGKRKGMATKCETEILTLEHYLELKAESYEFEGQSYLFWEFMRLLNEVKPKYFLLENVEMGEKWEKVLSKAIGVNGIHINSALVSAQNRKRIYWTNIGMVPGGLFGYPVSIIQQPKDKGILLKDILESEVYDKYFLSDKMLKVINKHGAIDQIENEKSNCILSSYFKMGGIDQQYVKDFQGLDINKKSRTLRTGVSQSQDDKHNYDLIVHNTMPRSSKTGKGGTGPLSRADGKTYCLDTGNTNAVEIQCASMVSNTNYVTNVKKDNLVKQLNPSTESNGKQPYQQNRVYDIEGINPSLTTLWNGSNLINTSRIRRLTPTECERLQTVADGYTAHVSDTQRYRMLGNGWTISVIAHIFSYLPKNFF